MCVCIYIYIYIYMAWPLRLDHWNSSPVQLACLSSSEPSAQSCWPSHCRTVGIHPPDLHRNSSDRHRIPAVGATGVVLPEISIAKIITNFPYWFMHVHVDDVCTAFRYRFHYFTNHEKYRCSSKITQNYITWLQAIPRGWRHWLTLKWIFFNGYDG